MNNGPDFPRLEKALDEAIHAVPAKSCEHNDAGLRRACHELVLLLAQTQERVRHLRDVFARFARPPG
jgi:hypothetical protein